MHCSRPLALTSVSVDFAVVVLDEFFYESPVLVQDLVSHVGDVMEHRLILHLKKTNMSHTPGIHHTLTRNK